MTFSLNGAVRNGIDKSDPNGKQVALKHMRFNFLGGSMDDLSVDGAILEVYVTTQPQQHANILKCYQVFLLNNKLTMVLELMHGSLAALIRKTREINYSLPEGIIAYIATQVSGYHQCNKCDLTSL